MPVSILQCGTGHRQGLHETVKADTTLFHTWLDNDMVRRDFRLNSRDSIVYDGVTSPVQAIQNAAIARVNGV